MEPESSICEAGWLADCQGPTALSTSSLRLALKAIDRVVLAHASVDGSQARVVRESVTVGIARSKAPDAETLPANPDRESRVLRPFTINRP